MKGNSQKQRCLALRHLLTVLGSTAAHIFVKTPHKKYIQLALLGVANNHYGLYACMYT